MFSTKTAILAALLLCTSALSAAEPAPADPRGSNVDLGFHEYVFASQIGTGAFRGARSNQFRSVNSGSFNCNSTSAGGNRIIRYPFRVPDNRELDFVRVWGFKGSATADVPLRVYRSCMSQNQVSPTTNTLATVTLTGSPGEFSQFLNVSGEQPNNVDCHFWLQVEFGTEAAACTSAIANLGIYKMRIQSRMPDRIFRNSFRIHVPG